MARAGKFDRYVTIEYKATTRDGNFGTQIITWTTLASVWANVQDMLPSRSEGVRQGLTEGRDQTRIRVRYRADINSSMRIVVHDESDEIYQIVSGPVMIGKREQLEMMCEKFTS